MSKIFYTDEEAAKLIDCEVLYDYTEWRGGHKFLRRSRHTVTCLSKYKENKWVIVRRVASQVKVDGVRLEYIGKYSFTNPKKPFKTSQA